MHVVTRSQNPVWLLERRLSVDGHPWALYRKYKESEQPLQDVVRELHVQTLEPYRADLVCPPSGSEVQSEVEPVLE